jgi:quercetin dioxygenase-like cupin family protein
MRRLGGLLLCIGVLVLGIMPLVATSPAVAQDATPSADMETEEGVTFTPLGFADGVALPSTASLIALRVSIEPGAVSVFDETDPSSALLVVESGTFTAQIEADWSLTRGDAEFGESEAVAVGEEATLSAGDVAYIPGSVAGEIRNDGQEPAIGMVTLIVPGSLADMAEATPAS